MVTTNIPQPGNNGKLTELENMANKFVDTVLKERPIEYHRLYDELESQVEAVPEVKGKTMVHEYNRGWRIHRRFDSDSDLDMDILIHLDEMSSSDLLATELTRAVINNDKVAYKRIQLSDDEQFPWNTDIWFYHIEWDSDRVIADIHEQSKIGMKIMGSED